MCIGVAFTDLGKGAEGGGIDPSSPGLGDGVVGSVSIGGERPGPGTAPTLELPIPLPPLTSAIPSKNLIPIQVYNLISCNRILFVVLSNHS